MIRTGGEQAELERAANPHLGTCQRCERPWIAGVKPRSVVYVFKDEHAEGCFALCTDCWDETTLAERVAYWAEAYRRWNWTADWDTIVAAIRRDSL